MAKSPTVSVVLPVYRPHPEFFAQAIDSVIAQTYEDWELVIVEDPSEHLGREIIEKRADPRIRYILNPVRTALARQHNRAVSEARGQLIARFDADDLCEPDRLEKQVTFLASHPEVDVVASQMRIIDASGLPIGVTRYPCDHAAILRAMRRYNPISGSNVMFRRRVVDQVGGWRETSIRPAQDYEWYSRVLSRGFRFAVHPDCLVKYRRHDGQIKRTKLRGTILTTLEVKARYWLSSMDPWSLLLFVAEGLLLVLPPTVVLWLLRRVRYRNVTSHEPGATA